MELMLNIAARRHDAHVIGRQHLRKGFLSWRPSKTSQSTGKVLTIRVLQELQAALDAMPHSDALTFMLTEYGRPFASAAAFGNKFADWCEAARLEPAVCDDGKVRNYRAHGLRKAAFGNSLTPGVPGRKSWRSAVTPHSQRCRCISMRSSRIGWLRRRWSSALPDQIGHRP